MRIRTAVGTLALIGGFLALPPSQVRGTDSATASTTGSLVVSHGSAAGLHLSMVGSLVALDSLGRASAEMTRASLRAMEASADLATGLVVTSVRYVEDVAIVSFRASAASIETTANTASEVIEFTVEISRTALDASLAGSAAALNAMLDGIEVAVVVIPLIVGASGQLIGYQIALTSAPDTVVCAVFNEVGQQLYAGQLHRNPTLQ